MQMSWKERKRISGIAHAALDMRYFLSLTKNTGDGEKRALERVHITDINNEVIEMIINKDKMEKNI